MNDRNAAGWRDFWKQDCRASCLPDNPATEREIAAAWQGWLGEAADGSRLLDVATGNGIVLAWAAAAGRERGRRYALTGVDLADIDPPAFVSELDPDLAAAHFVGNTGAEALPFADAEFDLVTSQYGLEYAGLDAALAEVARVLAPGGRLVWLAHCETSEVVRQHRAEARELELLLGDAGLLAAMESIARALAAGKVPDAARTQLERAFEEAQHFARSHPPARLINEVGGGLARIAGRLETYAPAKLGEILATARERLEAHRARIASLLAAVLAPDRLEQVRARLTAPPWSDLAIEEVRVGRGDSPIGLHITAARATTR